MVVKEYKKIALDRYLKFFPHYIKLKNYIYYSDIIKSAWALIMQGADTEVPQLYREPQGYSCVELIRLLNTEGPITGLNKGELFSCLHR